MADSEWAIWRNVPARYSGVWKAHGANGWTYLGAFNRGTLVCGYGTQPDTDVDTLAAHVAMMELTLSCAEPRLRPVLPVRVLAFSRRSAAAS